MFASSIPYKFTQPWAAAAATGYVTTTIPATATGANASQALGFPPITATNPGAGGVPPSVADINGGLLYATAWAQWLQAGAPIGYDATFSAAIGGYPKGAFLLAASGAFHWISTADNNTTDPDTGGAGWVQLYANFAGSSSQVFNVANATTSTEAVALGQFVNSFATNGYAKLPGGLIIQWGETSTAAGGTYIALPITFPNACINASATNYATSAPSVWPAVGNVTSNSISIWQSSSSTVGAGGAVWWMAIGY